MGESLVEELRRMATSGSGSLTELLRHARVVADKLNLEDAVTWIDNEIDGYESGEVPEYRKLQCQLKVQVRGRWEPVPWDAANPLQQVFSIMPSGHPISEVEEMARGGDEKQRDLRQEEYDLLREWVNADLASYRLARFFARASFVGIVSVGYRAATRARGTAL